MKRGAGFVAWAVFVVASVASAAEWQWSVPMGEGRAFLWVPPTCSRVRAVMVGQNNLLEQRLLEHPVLRAELGRLGIAEAFIAPPFDLAFDFPHGAGGTFDAMMRRLAAESGYDELAVARVVPIGHSACASFPWNFAAWSPQRTLAVISLKGDAPETTMTGYGGPGIVWGNRDIDGVPGLMVMGEYEWLDTRLEPAETFRARHPLAPLAMLAEPGHGHFDCSDELVAFIAQFVRQAVHYRLPANDTADAPALLPVNPRLGWLVQRWRLNQLRTIPAAPAREYTGDPAEAFWCFDGEMARATENFRREQIGRKPQLLAFVQDGAVVPQTATHQQVNLRCETDDDDVTFHLGTTFLATVGDGSPNLSRWTQLSVAQPLGHARTGVISLSCAAGPVVQVTADTFRLQLDRTSATNDRRREDIWLLATHPGDAEYKSAVQQALMRLPRHTTGASQRIEFAPLPDQRVGTRSIPLQARSSADSAAVVRFFVREGPAEVDGTTLRFTAIPPRAKFPVKVTVVAWQLGRSRAPQLQAAPLVERTLQIQR